jgi:hypothetical protein
MDLALLLLGFTVLPLVVGTRVQSAALAQGVERPRLTSGLVGFGLLAVSVAVAVFLARDEGVRVGSAIEVR